MNPAPIGHRGEHGQTLVMMMCFIAVLLGFSALVIQGGNAFLQRRQMQGIADSAATAGVQRITASRAEADAVAREYATTQNSGAGGSVHTIVTTGSSSSSCNGRTVPPYSVCVRTQRSDNSLFGSMLKGSTIRAQAIASASQVRNMSGWLPFGVMNNQYVSGTQLSFRPGSVAPAGGINTPAGATCKFYGGNGVRDVIASAAHGGADACPIDLGQSIETQTGVASGNYTQGFADRLGGNTDSFNDVFELDTTSGRYIVKKPDSPRLGVVPLAGGNGNWPLNGGASMIVAGYSFAYIGNRNNPPSFPAISGSGNGMRIYLTPVNALLPEDWDAQFSAFAPGSNNIVAYHLVD